MSCADRASRNSFQFLAGLLAVTVKLVLHRGPELAGKIGGAVRRKACVERRTEGMTWHRCVESIRPIMIMPICNLLLLLRVQLTLIMAISLNVSRVGNQHEFRQPAARRESSTSRKFRFVEGNFLNTVSLHRLPPYDCLLTHITVIELPPRANVQIESVDGSGICKHKH